MVDCDPVIKLMSVCVCVCVCVCVYIMCVNTVLDVEQVAILGKVKL